MLTILNSNGRKQFGLLAWHWAPTTVIQKHWHGLP
jgi:hypothetical protein